MSLPVSNKQAILYLANDGESYLGFAGVRASKISPVLVHFLLSLKENQPLVIYDKPSLVVKADDDAPEKPSLLKKIQQEVGKYLSKPSGDPLLAAYRRKE